VTDIVTILPAASANGTGFTLDAGDLKGAETLEAFTTGTVSAFSVQLQGSLDGVNWVAVGAPLTTATTADVSSGLLARWFRAVLSGYSGTGTVTARLGFAAGGGSGGGSGGGDAGSGVFAFQSGAPSGTPSGGTGSVIFQTATNQLWVYNGSWMAVSVS
jgi:hypothetical protein